MPRNFEPTKILQEHLPTLGSKGGLLAVSENGKIRTFSAGSISATDHNRLYYIYSISKTFTATAIMELCEEQGDFLDERFSKYFPETTIPHNITVRQLLNHTSGLSDYFNSKIYQQALKENPTTPWSYKKLMEVGLANTPMFEPEEGWAYSNPAYGLLKELIESKSGMGYYDYITQRIIKKCHLSHTKPFLKPDYHLELLEGEDDSFIGDFRPQYQPEWIATGCLISTVSDVAKFYDALFGGLIISQESLSEMKKTVSIVPNPPKESIPSYGLGLMHFKNSPLGDSYGHGGGGPGYTTYATHFPDLEGNRVTISLVLNNSLPQTPFDLVNSIATHYIDSKN